MNQVSLYSNAYLDLVDVIILIINKDYTVELINKKACNILGYSKNEVIGKNWFEIFLPDSTIPREKRRFDQMIASGADVEIESFENEILTSWNDIKSIKWSVHCYKDENNNVISIVGSGEDVTTKKRAEKGSMRNKHFAEGINEINLRALIDNTSDLIWSVNTEYNFIAFNSAFKMTFHAITGAEPVIGEAFDFRGFSSDLISSWKSYYERAFLGERFVVELASQRKDKDLIFEYSFNPIIDQNGLLAGVAVSGRNITGQKQAEAKLIETARQLKEKNEQLIKQITLLDEKDKVIEGYREFEFLTDMMPQIVWRSNPDGSIDYYNERWLEYTGFSASETMELSWQTILHPDEYTDTFDQWNACMQSGEEYNMEHRLKGKDGSYRWMLTRAVPYKNGDGEIVRWYGTATDIHDQKLTEQMLKESVMDFMALGDAMPQIVWIAGTEGKIEYFNKKWFDYTALSLKQSMMDEWLNVLHPDDVQNAAETWAFSLKSGRAYEIEYRFRRTRDNTYRWHLGRALPVKNDQGKIVKWFGTCTDIDDFKRSEQEALDSKKRLQTVINTAPIILWSVDNDGRFILCDGKGLEKLKIPVGSYIGQSCFELFDENGPNSLKNIRRALAGEQFTDTMDLQGLTFQTYYCPMKEGEKILGMVGVSLDITQMKRAETASQFKTRFLANMSHEIRTPLNAIIGFANLLTRKELNEEDKEYLSHIITAGNLLLKLVGDILDLSKIEEGKLQVTKERFHLKEMITSELEPYKFKANEKGLEFKLEFSKNLSPYIYGDPFRIKQILVNLIGNALKFTKEGGIHIRITQSARPSFKKEKELKFEVIDTGIGISKESREDIFQPFTQGAPSILKEFGGSGLGLTIVKQLVSLMEGEIFVKSPFSITGKKSEKGTNVYFVLKTEVAEAESKEPEAIIDPASIKFKRELKILVAEDNIVNQKLVGIVLKNIGCSVDFACNGKEAVNLVSKYQYDLVLMDTQMPVMDGIEATRIIKKDQKNSIPIVGLSANVFKDDVDRCINAGMEAHLGKPYTEDQLFKMIKKVLNYEF